MTSPELAVEPMACILDLEITIRVDGAASLQFEVHGPRPEEGINTIALPPVPLGMSAEKFFYYLFRDIQDLPLGTTEEREVADQRLAAKGLTVWRLFPRELQALLWKRRRRAQTLLIQSDEPFIPWEIAQLQGRDRDGRRVVTGPFLCEAFAVTRWVRGVAHQTHLPMQDLALVVPRDSQLKEAAAEQAEILALASRYGRRAADVEPKYLPLRQELASGTHGGWHFAGHSLAAGEDANRWAIELDGPSHFRVEDLLGEPRNLGIARPLVFLNGCTTGRGGFTLTGPGGWARGFLEAGAGAFIGTYWGIADGKSRELAIEAYEGLFKGLPIGEAFRKARLRLHRRHKGNPTWLAYTVFAHPLASCSGVSTTASRRQPGTDRRPPQIAIPIRRWRAGIDGQAALLRAQYGIVRFHRRDQELGDLEDWCRDPSAVRVRLYTGPGGMGKTRLALEAARSMRSEGWWSGFATKEAIQAPEKTWRALARPEGRLLLIVDYAETNRPFLIPVLREMYRFERGPVRLILLARAALDWWEQLKGEREGVGEILSGPATSRHALRPLADTVEARVSSYAIAVKAFSRHLQVAPPAAPPEDLDAKHFERVLLLHMKALIDVKGEEAAKAEDDILDRTLARERWFWEARARDQGLSGEIVGGIGRAMAAITLGGGVEGEAEALHVLRGLRLFADQPMAVLAAVARLLHECSPGERWIEPLQPDLLGEHLVQRELEQGHDELLDIVLGPRQSPDPGSQR